MKNNHRKEKKTNICSPLSPFVYSDVFVPGHVRGYSLKNLLPGNYDIFMRVNTDAGAGAAGPIINVHIGEDRTHTWSWRNNILLYVLC